VHICEDLICLLLILMLFLFIKLVSRPLNDIQSGDYQQNKFISRCIYLQDFVNL